MGGNIYNQVHSPLQNSSTLHPGLRPCMLVGQHKSMYRCTSGKVPMHCALGQDLRCRAGDKHAHTKSAADMSLNIQSNTSRCCADLKRAYVDLWETCNTQASPALINALQPKWCIAYPQKQLNFGNCTPNKAAQCIGACCIAHWFNHLRIDPNRMQICVQCKLSQVALHLLGARQTNSLASKHQETCTHTSNPQSMWQHTHCEQHSHSTQAATQNH